MAKSQAAIDFHNYIYSDTTDATVATVKGLNWYLANKNTKGITPQSIVDLWNESEGTAFTVSDLNAALARLPGANTTTTTTTTTKANNAIPLLIGAAVLYFGLGG
jgi:hypothetical protein